jgi:hypothetical protein
MFGAIDTYQRRSDGSIPRESTPCPIWAPPTCGLGQFDDGIAEYNAALKIEPANTTIRMNLALAYLQVGTAETRPSSR